MNRVLIFGLPRTGTTILEEFLKTKYRSPKITEPYGRDEIRKNYINFTKNLLPNTVVKLLTTSCCSHHPVDISQLIGLDVFDKIVVTHRNDLVDICLSLYYADYVVQKFQWDQSDDVVTKSFECDITFAENFSRQFDFFEKTLAWFDQIRLKYDRFDYDAFLSDEEQNIFGFTVSQSSISSKFKKSNLDYKTLCVNYDAVAEVLGSRI